MHAALALTVGGERKNANIRRRARNHAHSEIFAPQGPWRAAQGPICIVLVKKFIPPSVTGEELWEERGSFFLHFSYSVGPRRET